MTTTTAVPIPGITGELLESPVWDDRRKLLWFVDIAGREVLGIDPADESGRTVMRRFAMPSEPGCVALAADDSLVVALRDRVAQLDVESGNLTTLALADHDSKTTRLNDGRCDRQGRFWVGSMYEPRDKPLGRLYRLDGNRLVSVIDGITLANGLAFDPDGHGGWHADSPSRTIWRFKLDPKSGNISDRHAFLQFGPDARPDGATVDSNGAYWVAAIDAGEVRRYLPDGRIERRVTVPTPWPTMPAFGGDDLRWGFVTSLRAGRPAERLAAHPFSGGLFRFRSEIAGVAEPRVLL